MSIQTAKKVAWKKYKVTVLRDTAMQSCSPLGKSVLKCIFKAVLGKSTSHMDLFLSSVQAALTDFVQVCWKQQEQVVEGMAESSSRERLLIVCFGFGCCSAASTEKHGCLTATAAGPAP